MKKKRKTKILGVASLLLVFTSLTCIMMFGDFADNSISQSELSAYSRESLKNRLIESSDFAVQYQFWSELLRRRQPKTKNDTETECDRTLIEFIGNQSNGKLAMVTDLWLAAIVSDTKNSATALHAIETIRCHPSIAGPKTRKCLLLGIEYPIELRLAAGEALVKCGEIKQGRNLLFTLARSPSLRNRVRFRLLRLTGQAFRLDQSADMVQIDRQIDIWKSWWDQELVVHSGVKSNAKPKQSSTINSVVK